MSMNPEKFKEALANNPRLKRLHQTVEANRLKIQEKTIEMQKRFGDFQRDQSRDQIRFWMDSAIIPYLEEIAKVFNEPLTAGIRRLILDKKNPLVTRKDEAESAIQGFFSLPSNKVLQFMARPYIRVQTEIIVKEAEWIREVILKEEYPDLYDVITKTEGGTAWLDDLIKTFVQIIRKI